MIPGQANFLQSLGWAVLNSLWQMALLWVIYHLITGLNRSFRSSFKSSFAFVLLIVGFVLFVYTFISFYTSPATGQFILASSIPGIRTDEQFSQGLQQALSIASVLYLLLLMLPLVQFIRNYRYVQVIRNYGLSKMNVQWRVFIQKVAARMGLKKPVHIWVSEFVSSPVTIGFLKPVVLVPLAAINHLSAQQMEAVLLHELAHIRRYDYLVNLIINFIQSVLYFNPFVKGFVKIIEREREKSCDETVLQFQYDSYEYATALLSLEKANRRYNILAVGATGKKNALLQRVEMIMGIKATPVLSFQKVAGVLAGLVCVLALNAFLVIQKPATGKSTYANAGVSSPFNFFTSSMSESPGAKIPGETSPGNIITKSAGTFVANPVMIHDNTAPLPPLYKGVIPVSYYPVEVTELKDFEEAQVKSALDASKKVIENEEWKALEKNIADVLNQKEKEELKATYKMEMDKIDWNKWENKLRQSYANVNWNLVNDQLARAVNNIRIDSLKKVYTEAICKLDMTQQELALNHLTGIPDTDVTLKTIEETKQQVQKTLNKLKAVRNRKIVHL